MLNARIPIDNQIEHMAPGAKTKGAKAYEALAEEVMHDVNFSRNAANNSSENAATAAHVSE
jgi:hypothetical protein